jgi:hypothetical protein
LLARISGLDDSWSVDDPRFAAFFVFSGMHGIVDEARLKEGRIARGRLIKWLRRTCFGVAGLPSHTPDI